MKLSVTEEGDILLEEVSNSITLVTSAGESLSICMRDTGFEFYYQGKPYFAKEGFVEPFNVSVRGNHLVEQRHIYDGVCCSSDSNTIE